MTPGFFHESPLYGPLIHTRKHFRILVRILGDIRILKLFCRVSDPAEHKLNFQIGGPLSMDLIQYALGSLVYTCRRFSKSVPLKRMTSSKNIFVWFCGVLICQRGLIPRRTRPCGVSDPAEQSLAGYQNPQNNGRFVYIL